MATRGKSVRKGHGPRHGSEVVRLPESGDFRIVMISDTHSKAHPNSARVAASLKPDLVLHGGDIGEPRVLAPFQELAPFHAVRGNIDPRGPEWLDSIDLVFRRGNREVLRLLLTHIAVYGASLRADARRLAAAHNCSLVVCGHSHVPFIGHDRGITIMNPGSIGPRRFNLPIVMGVLDILEKGFKARHVSCETGETWTPS